MLADPGPRWATPIEGNNPVIVSYTGRGAWPTCARTQEDIDSTKRRCDSACKVSKANEVFPDPLTPHTTTSSPWGTSAVTPRRLCSAAPTTRRVERMNGGVIIP